MWRFLLRIAFVFSLIALFAYCGTSDNSPGEQAQIPDSNATVTFLGSTWSDVTFKHAEHSERFGGECIKCHDHEPIAGKTHWYCRECHTAGQDREKLCSPVPEHGCIMTQCDTCHKAQVNTRAPQAQNCMRCHEGGQISGVDKQAPTVPAGLTATAVSPSQIDLSWTASTDNMSVTGYKIYRGGVYLKPVAGTSTSDTGLSASTQYCYQVSAYDGANNESAKSTEPCATTRPDTATPTVPTGLTATAVSSNQTSLSWTASTDNVAVVGYKIYRGGAYLKSVTGTSTTDTVPSNTLYCYQVAAYDESNHESNMSTQACASSTVASGTTYPGTPSLVLTSSIDPWNKIDHWYFTLATLGTITIDVNAWESCLTNGGKWNGTDYFGDGPNNNRLQSNIYLFKPDGTPVSSAITQYPGENRLDPRAHYYTSARNPYISMSVSAGTYLLAIGNCPLSPTDAWTGVNTDSTLCGGRSWTNLDSNTNTTLYNKYKINIYFK